MHKLNKLLGEGVGVQREGAGRTPGLKLVDREAFKPNIFVLP